MADQSEMSKEEEAGLTNAVHQVPTQGPTAPMFAGVTMLMAQPVLPPSLWPHDFLPLSLLLAILLGILNPFFTLPFTGIAIALSLLSKSLSRRGNYTSARFYSKVVLGLLIAATSVWGATWTTAWVVGMGWAYPLVLTLG